MITETERLILRNFEMNDLDSFLKYRNDPLVSKYQDLNTVFSKQDGEKFILAMNKIDLTSSQGWIQIAIELKDTGIHMGDCAIKRFDEGRQAEIGITIDRDYWNKGFAFEGLSGLFSIAFSNLAIHRIIGITDTRNERSIRLLTKLTMRKEGYTRESYYDNGEWTDEFQFAILNQEWNEIKISNIQDNEQPY